ncbi:hypothetical protein [Actinomadura hibisca]|nr:hypothetical protein [Actinomadura hibisca]
MGKHGKKVDCGMCGGTGRLWTTQDNKRLEIKCVGCDGTGQQG